MRFDAHATHRAHQATPSHLERPLHQEAGKNEEMMDYEKKLAALKNCRTIQCDPGTVAAGEYMRGMANGLILAEAIMEEKDPDYVGSLDTQEPGFDKALERLINYHSMENDSDTPDWLLAEYLKGCLENFGAVMKKRDKYYQHSDGEGDGTGPAETAIP